MRPVGGPFRERCTVSRDLVIAPSKSRSQGASLPPSVSPPRGPSLRPRGVRSLSREPLPPGRSEERREKYYRGGEEGDVFDDVSAETNWIMQLTAPDPNELRRARGSIFPFLGRSSAR